MLHTRCGVVAGVRQSARRASSVAMPPMRMVQRAGRGMPVAAVRAMWSAWWVGMKGVGERASASWRWATSRKNVSSPIPLILSVVEAIGHFRGAEYPAGRPRPCQEGDKAEIEPASGERDNARCANDSAAGKLARCVAGKQWWLLHGS